MANTFEIVGKLSIGRETEKFKPYEVNTYDSGWVSNRLMFNVVSGDNRHFLESKGGYFKNGKGKVYSFTKSGVDNNGDKVKGEKTEIPWEDRFKPEIIENIAEFKKFVIDLEVNGRRYKLEKALERFNDGTLKEEELEELGVEDIGKALEDSKKKRKEFIAEADFTEYLYKLIASEKLNNKLVKVIGNIVYQEYNGKIYEKLIPTRVYLVTDDTEQKSTGMLTVFFDKNCVEDKLKDKTNKIYLNCYVREYDNQRQKNIFCPLTLILDLSNPDNEIVNNLILSQFKARRDEIKEFGVKIKILNGSQKVEISDDMLNEFQKQMLQAGAITEDDIRKELGGDVYGDPVKEMIIVNVARGYSKGSKDTLYKPSDLIIEELQLKDNKVEVEEDDDIFSDLPDLD